MNIAECHEHLIRSTKFKKKSHAIGMDHGEIPLVYNTQWNKG